MAAFSTTQTALQYRRQFYLTLGLSAFFATSALAQTSAIQPDASFGTAGSTSVGLPGAGGMASSSGGANTVANYDDLGQLLVTGTHIWVCGGGTNAATKNSSIRRFLPNGTPDTAFGTNGTLQAPFGIRGAAVQPDGKLVVVGAYNNTVATIGLARYDAAGVLDPSFGTAGVVQGSQAGELRRVFVLPGGKLLAIGWNNGAGRTQVYRLLANGQLDTTFNNGSAITSYSGDLETVAMQPDGRIVLVSTEYPASTPGAHGVTVTRLLATGDLDITFGTAGRASITGRRTNNQGQLYYAQTETLGVAVQPADSKIVLTGFTFSGSYGQAPVLLRLNADGSPDTAFNNLAVSGVPMVSVLNSVVVQPNGDLIVAGSGAPFPSNTPQTLIARFSSAGVLDASFGPNVAGTYLQPLSTNRGTVSEMMWQAPGQLLALGGYEMLNGQPIGLRLSRYRLATPSATRTSDAAVLQLQAAPVPAHEQVTLQYTLPAPTAVRVVLHDQLGRPVSLPQPGQSQAAGPQQLTFDTQPLADGLYFCTLEAGALRQTIRLAVAH